MEFFLLSKFLQLNLFKNENDAEFAMAIIFQGLVLFQLVSVKIFCFKNFTNKRIMQLNEG